MGLAPYGKPIYTDKILNYLIDVKEDGTFNLDQEYFNYATGLTMTNKKFHDLFGNKPRDSKIREFRAIPYGYCFINSESNRRYNDQIM